nr:hypothetical protein OHB51_25020 [Micromonospora sp. NBC_00855]
MSITPVIDVDRLNLTYGDFHAVKDLTFQVRSGRRPASGTMHDPDLGRHRRRPHHPTVPLGTPPMTTTHRQTSAAPFVNPPLSNAATPRLTLFRGQGVR